MNETPVDIRLKRIKEIVASIRLDTREDAPPAFTNYDYKPTPDSLANPESMRQAFQTLYKCLHS